jgi:hypothetical protein
MQGTSVTQHERPIPDQQALPPLTPILSATAAPLLSLKPSNFEGSGFLINAVFHLCFCGRVYAVPSVQVQRWRRLAIVSLDRWKSRKVKEKAVEQMAGSMDDMFHRPFSRL